MIQKQHYTFGDTDLAAERLRLLARVFAPSSARLLASLSELGGELAVDLGCGPGHSTELLAGHVPATRVIGLDRSPHLLEQARREHQNARLSFLSCDVSLAPLPVPKARFLYSRFLLTHLRDPAQVVSRWADAAEPNARLVLEETAFMSGEHPAFSRYYALVERMQAHYGQRMYIGRELEALSSSAQWVVERAQLAESCLPATDMAKLHFLNLQTWSQDAFALEHYGDQGLYELGEELRLIASGTISASPVSLGMGQVVLGRR